MPLFPGFTPLLTTGILGDVIRKLSTTSHLFARFLNRHGEKQNVRFLGMVERLSG
jgi:hypothetical protein